MCSCVVLALLFVLFLVLTSAWWAILFQTRGPLLRGWRKSHRCHSAGISNPLRKRAGSDCCALQGWPGSYRHQHRSVHDEALWVHRTRMHGLVQVTRYINQSCYVVFLLCVHSLVAVVLTVGFIQFVLLYCCFYTYMGMYIVICCCCCCCCCC
jgi:hypothetical protein